MVQPHSRLPSSEAARLTAVSIQAEQRRNLSAGDSIHRSDRVFGRVIATAAFAALIVLAGITAFLGAQAVPVLADQGIDFLTTTRWDSQANVYGIWGMLYGSVLLAVIGLVIAVPASLLLSVFVVFIAPRRVSVVLVNLIDLMAAVPSVIIGLWAFYVLAPPAEGWQAWLSSVLGWIPVFANDSGNFSGTPFIAGLVLAIMMIPIITSVSREVLGRTPPDLINAAEALGCSRWTMLRDVALPFGRAGLVGGVMLGLGRALGETIAVFFVLKLVFDVNWFHVLESGGGSIATLIVAKFSEASGQQEVQVLLAAGFFLFLGTLVVNVLANLVIRRAGKLAA